MSNDKPNTNKPIPHVLPYLNPKPYVMPYYSTPYVQPNRTDINMPTAASSIPQSTIHSQSHNSASATTPVTVFTIHPRNPSPTSTSSRPYNRIINFLKRGNFNKPHHGGHTKRKQRKQRKQCTHRKQRK